MEKKLENEIELLKQKANRASVALRDKEEEYTKLLVLPSLRKMVGKCFKYINSYGGDIQKKWNLYIKIVSIDEKNISFTCVEFQRTSLEIVEVRLSKKYNWGGKNHFKDSNYIPIKNSEYNRAKKSLLKFITNKLSN